MATPHSDWVATVADIARLDNGRYAIPVSQRCIHIAGPQALACLQGILTNDIASLAPGAMRHAAVLTAKGMIITPLWCARDGEGYTLIVPAAGETPLRELLARSFPPRLARVIDQPVGTLYWLRGDVMPEGDNIFRADGPAPCAAIARSAETDAPPKGFTLLAPWYADVLALMAGWPILGREIDERTLIQEVRFDEWESVSYTKGCYVGQETVARLHFRGHANRTLRALLGNGAPPTDDTVQGPDGKPVGHFGSLGVVDEHWIAACRLRREVATGDTVTVAGCQARVHDFPITLAQITGEH